MLCKNKGSKKFDLRVKVKGKGDQGQIMKNAQNGQKYKIKGLKKCDLEVKVKVKGHQGQILKITQNGQKQKIL